MQSTDNQIIVPLAKKIAKEKAKFLNAKSLVLSP